MSYFNIISQSNENTIITEYTSMTTHSDSYQSEVTLEYDFIKIFTNQGY